MAISKALSALAGIARGGKTLIEKEEKETSAITKIGLEQTLKNIATAKKNHLTDMAEFREQIRGVEALQKFTYKDPESGKQVPVTRAQAIALIEATGGSKEAFKALQDAEVAFKGTGEVGPIKYTKSGALDQETVSAFEAEDETVGVAPLSLAKGRNTRAMANVQKVVEKLGLPKEGYQTPMGLPEVSGVQIISTKNANGEDVKSIDKGTITATVNGKEQTTFAFLGNDRILYVLEGNKPIPVADSSFKEGVYTPKVSRTSEEPSIKELSNDYVKDYFQESSFTTQREAYVGKQAAVKALGEGYNQMGPLALDNAVYSVVATTVGRVTKAVQIEIEGIKAISTATDTERNSIADIQDLDKFIQNNRSATDLAMKAKVLDAMVVRNAYKFLQANGDTRPSDADLRRAMLQFSAGSAEEFFNKAQANWETVTTETRQMREAFLGHPAFNMYTVMPYSDSEKKILEPIVEQFKPEEMAVNPPYFLADGFDKEALNKAKETPIEQEDITIDVTVGDQTIQATYDPETDEVVVGNLSMSSSDAISRGLITLEAIKALRNQ